MELSEIDTKIYRELLAKLPDRTTPNPAALILFCGIPGSGKTTLAQRLARDLHAQYLQNDAARSIAKRLGVAKYDAHTVSRALVHDIITDDANKLIVLDASIDRTWRSALQFCEENGAVPIIVRITIDPAEATARVQRRGRPDDAEIIARTPERLAQFEACKKELPADIELTVPFDYEKVLAAVREKLTRL